MKRIKLAFQGDLVDKEQKRVWFLIPEQVVKIADLHYWIFDAFGLKNKCPYGVTLSMDGYTLLPSQSVHILRENDKLRVIKAVNKRKRKRAIGKKKLAKWIEELVDVKMQKHTDGSSGYDSDSSSPVGSETTRERKQSSKPSKSSSESSSESSKSTDSSDTSSDTEIQENVKPVQANMILESVIPTSHVYNSTVEKPRKRRKRRKSLPVPQKDILTNDSIVYVNKIGEERKKEVVDFDALEDFPVNELTIHSYIAYKTYEISPHYTPEIGPWRVAYVQYLDVDQIQLRLDEQYLYEEGEYLAYLFDTEEEKTVTIKPSDFIQLKRMP